MAQKINSFTLTSIEKFMDEVIWIILMIFLGGYLHSKITLKTNKISSGNNLDYFGNKKMLLSIWTIAPSLFQSLANSFEYIKRNKIISWNAV